MVLSVHLSQDCTDGLCCDMRLTQLDLSFSDKTLSKSSILVKPSPVVASGIVGAHEAWAGRYLQGSGAC